MTGVAIDGDNITSDEFALNSLVTREVFLNLIHQFLKVFTFFFEIMFEYEMI